MFGAGTVRKGDPSLTVRLVLGEDPLRVVVDSTLSRFAQRLRERTGGRRGRLRDIYATADLFVLPSWYEGYGIVYTEALAHGLPVLACDVGPVPELVGKEAGLLVPPGDIGALSEALNLLLSDVALRDRMSAARRRADRLPRWADTVVAFRQILKEILAPRSARWLP